jgi:mRNA interferase MazF
VLILRELPPFRVLLVCGLSTQLHQQVIGIDEVLSSSDADFKSSGLITASLIRLCFLSRLSGRDIVGPVGAVSAGRHERLLRRLSRYLVEHLSS